MVHNTGNVATEKPKFSLYPKRKSLTVSESTLYMRISYQFTQIDKSLGIKIQFEDWDSTTHKLLNNPYHQKHIDEVFDEYRQKLMGAFYLFTQNAASPTLREIYNLAFGEESKKTYSLFGVFNGFILKLEKQNPLPSQRSNILKHHTCMKHLRDFVKSSFNSNDISFSRINRNFIDDFEMYLKSDGKNGHNATMKMLQIFKKIYRIAVDNRWTNHNAFAGKKLSYKDVDIEVLNFEEIQILKNATLQKSYLNKTRELFLFCIHTGMAYVDLQNLKRLHVEYNPVSGQYLIRKKREKTGVEFIVPLFPPAKMLLDQWQSDWLNFSSETLLSPKISNQKFNQHLKELFAVLSIQKKITTHVGRHTFATTLALENGVPIESVSKMVGHSKISQTQRYARVTSLKIERETKVLYEKLAG
jgi:site-specific recombinase XerD